MPDPAEFFSQFDKSHPTRHTSQATDLTDDPGDLMIRNLRHDVDFASKTIQDLYRKIDASQEQLDNYRRHDAMAEADIRANIEKMGPDTWVSRSTVRTLLRLLDAARTPQPLVALSLTEGLAMLKDIAKTRGQLFPMNPPDSPGPDLAIPSEPERNKAMTRRFIEDTYIASDNPDAFYELPSIYEAYCLWCAENSVRFRMSVYDLLHYLALYAADVETMLEYRPRELHKNHRFYGIVLRPHLLEKPAADEDDGITEESPAIRNSACIDEAITMTLWADRYLRALLERFVLSESAPRPEPLRIDCYDPEGLAKVSEALCQRIESYCNAEYIKQVPPPNFSPRYFNRETEEPKPEDLSPADSIEQRIGAE
jgi:hypothetical protein